MLRAALPRVTGTARPGQVLTGTPGTFSGAPDEVASQWLANGAPIAGATGPRLTLTAAHLGQRISYRSTATKAGETPVTSVSAATAAVANPAPPRPPRPPAKADSKTKVAKIVVKNRGKRVNARVRVRAAGKARPTGRVRIVIKRGKRTVAQTRVRVNKKGIAKLNSKRLKPKQRRALRKPGRYRVIATYQGSATVKPSRNARNFRVRR